jgi:outer membrane protein
MRLAKNSWDQRATAAMICAAWGASGLAQAQESKPLWEAGVGIATLSFPAYRGSDQTQAFVLPTPYFVYRGEFFKADREGLRAQLLGSERLELTLSGALSPPAPSDEVRARSGMPDLRANAEIGPQLNVRLWGSSADTHQLKLQLPLRAAFTLERKPKDLGWVFHPKLNLDLTALPGLPGWTLGLQAGPLFGDRKQHQYFYGVAPSEATPERASYQARAGFAGMQYLIGASRQYERQWVGAFVRYDSLSGATFANSPLVRTKNYFAAGVAVSWILGESAERVIQP